MGKNRLLGRGLGPRNLLVSRGLGRISKRLREIIRLFGKFSGLYDISTPVGDVVEATTPLSTSVASWSVPLEVADLAFSSAIGELSLSTPLPGAAIDTIARLSAEAGVAAGLSSDIQLHGGLSEVAMTAAVFDSEAVQKDTKFSTGGELCTPLHVEESES